ncbi:MAG: class I SAM-dependent methyltransferase [Rhodospirillales bacterium]
MTDLNASPSDYNARFFAYTGDSGQTSAAAVVPIVLGLLSDVRSVLDVGCAQGNWLRAWLDAGIAEVQGMDGDYVDQTQLRIPRNAFRPADLNADFDLGRKFDLVTSFETAEHLRPENSARFVANLARHGDAVLFSAAPPGQGGLNHINERPYDDWRDLFRAQGFHAYDAIRPQIRNHNQISFWYRYNMLLFVRAGAEGALTSAARAALIADGQTVPDISPAVFRLRKAMVRLLPRGVQDGLARLKGSVAGVLAA